MWVGLTPCRNAESTAQDPLMGVLTSAPHTACEAHHKAALYTIFIRHSLLLDSTVLSILYGGVLCRFV